MGSGDKFEITFVKGFGLAIFVDRFPHELSLNILLGCFNIYIGIGKGYDE